MYLRLFFTNLVRFFFLFFSSPAAYIGVTIINGVADDADARSAAATALKRDCVDPKGSQEEAEK
jgi:hypothetical protein